MAVDPGQRYHPAHAHNASSDHDDDDDQYDENADEDFNPDEAAGQGQDGEDLSSSDSSDDEAGSRKRKPASSANAKKRKPAVDDGLDSGDEATIKERKRRKKRGKAAVVDGDAAEEEEESGGEGGLIKTRAQRAAEKAERRHYRRAAAAGAMGANVTIDVEAVWAELKARPVGRPVVQLVEEMEVDVDVDGKDETTSNKVKEVDAGDEAGERDEMITITRTIAYAGEITEVEERVARTSKEGQAWLKAHPDANKASSKAQGAADSDPSSSILRPLKRPSLFEPNPSSVVKGVAPEKLRPHTPSRLDVLRASQRAAAEAKKRAEKMTTVQKSALDWQGFVAREAGLKEELEGYGKGKQGFLAREAFLDSVAGRREEAGREARLKG